VSARTLAGRVPPLGWVLLAAAAFLLFRLGSFGFWEPWEARLGDPGSAPAVPPAVGALLSAGAGMGEWGARSFFALVGVAAVAVTYWLGAGFFGRRAAVAAALALVTMPLFSFQARQLLSDMPGVLGLGLSLALGRFVWGGRRKLDLALGLAGMALATLSCGALLGVAVPVLALAAGLLATGGARRWVVALVVAGLLVTAVAFFKTHTAGAWSMTLGGLPRLGAPAMTFEWLIRQLGFGLFPWSALAFFALGQPLAADDERPAPARLFLLLFVGFALALATVRGYLVGEGRFAALVPIALALGAFLDEQAEAPDRLVALLAGVGAILVGRDLYLEPESLFSIHTLEKVKWPAGLEGKSLFVIVGVAFAGALWLGVLVRRRRAGFLATVGVAALFALVLTEILVPALSQHLSPRKVIDAYRRAATAGQPLGRYRVPAEGASALRSAPGPALASLEELRRHLARPEPAFVVVAAEELAPIDETLKVARQPYVVLDASSSRLLLLGNRLAPGEEDHNPLRQHVWMANSAGERPPWPAPRVPQAVVFADSVELWGADFPATVRRPGGFELTLYFRVLKKPQPGLGIFVHLVHPGEPLVNGDHQPVGGSFPTAHWVPGEFVRDTFTVELPLAIVSSGTYQVDIGLWPGGNRPGVKVTSGGDGRDHAALGTVVIK
jgi:4-amino-4-deoxy-L-arabinose transferase-like glycosyltransferase